MKTGSTLHVLAATAALCLLAGLWMTLRTLQAVGPAHRQTERRQEDLRQIAALQQTADIAQKALDEIGRMGAPTGSLQNLVAQILPGVRAEFSPAENYTAGGFTLHRQAVAWARVAPLNLAPLLEATDGRQPPWRIRELDLNASSAGAAQLHVLFEWISPGDTLPPAGGGAE